MRRSLKIMVAVTMLSSVVTASVALAPELSAESSNRAVLDVDISTPGLIEGSIVMTVTADQNVDLAAPDAAFWRLDAQSFGTRFLWDDTPLRTITLRNDLGEETSLDLIPMPEPIFDPAAHDIPVIHVTTSSPADLWDPATGIYVWGDFMNFEQRGSDWERNATWRLSIGDNVLVEQPIGLRIHGGYSRNYHQKGLRCYFDDYGTADELAFDVFDDGGPALFERLILRPNRYDDIAVNTNIAESWMRDEGHLGSRFRFVAVYLNDEYWGLYAIRERLDKKFFATTHGFDDGYILIKDNETETGNGALWWERQAALNNDPNPMSSAFYQSVDADIDLGSYIDWIFFNIFAVSGDNGFGYNLVIVRPDMGRWTFVMWDEDTIFRAGDEDANTFRYFSATDESEHLLWRAPRDVRPWDPERQRWQTMLRTLLKNPQFRERFRLRAEELLNGSLSVEALHARLDAVVAQQLPEIPRHADRWEGFRNSWYLGYVESVRDWIAYRHPVVQGQLSAFLADFDVTAPLVLASVGPNPAVEELTIRFETTRPTGDFVMIYDLRGRQVRRLETGDRSQATWNLHDDNMRRVPAGVYILRTADGREARQVTILR